MPCCPGIADAIRADLMTWLGIGVLIVLAVAVVAGALVEAWEKGRGR